MKCEEEISMAAALGNAVPAEKTGLRLLFWEGERDYSLVRC